MTQQIQLNTTVVESQLGQRLDQALAELFPDYSRTLIKKWILNNSVYINGVLSNKPKEKVLGGEHVSINAQLEENARWMPENIDLNIVYEDSDILVINKPCGLVVHPGAGNPEGTLLNALLCHYPPIAEVPRAGIVHRLDKDTTGLMVVAKTVPAQTKLVAALQAREIVREYTAIATGILIAGGKVAEPIARHPTRRIQMAVHPMGKSAVTHYRVIQSFRAHTHLRLRLETGRTHQIRVHMSHIRHPLVGDSLYAGRLTLPKSASESLITALRNFNHQALHASMLRLYHPASGIQMEWQAELPQDMVHLLATLKADSEALNNQMEP